MSDGPWIKFYPADWLTGTRGLSAAEIGIYITLIAMMYEKGAPVVLDTPRLSRACGIPAASFTKILTTLIEAKKITFQGGGLFHDRVRNELHTREASRVTASNNAKARWIKDQEKQSSTDAGAEPIASIARPRQNPDSRSQKESTQTDLIDRTSDSVGALSRKAAPREKRTRLTNEWVLPKSYGDWALAQGLPRDRILIEAEKMRNWSINAGRVGVKADWFAAWKNWTQKAIDELPRQRGSPSGRKSSLQSLTEDFVEELKKDGYGNEDEKGRNTQADARLPLLAGPDYRGGR